MEGNVSLSRPTKMISERCQWWKFVSCICFFCWRLKSSVETPLFWISSCVSPYLVHRGYLSFFSGISVTSTCQISNHTHRNKWLSMKLPSLQTNSPHRPLKKYYTAFPKTEARDRLPGFIHFSILMINEVTPPKKKITCTAGLPSGKLT